MFFIMRKNYGITCSLNYNIITGLNKLYFVLTGVRLLLQMDVVYTTNF